MRKLRARPLPFPPSSRSTFQSCPSSWDSLYPFFGYSVADRTVGPATLASVRAATTQIARLRNRLLRPTHHAVAVLNHAGDVVGCLGAWLSRLLTGSRRCLGACLRRSDRCGCNQARPHPSCDQSPLERHFISPCGLRLRCGRTMLEVVRNRATIDDSARAIRSVTGSRPCDRIGPLWYSPTDIRARYSRIERRTKAARSPSQLRLDYECTE